VFRNKPKQTETNRNKPKHTETNQEKPTQTKNNLVILYLNKQIKPYTENKIKAVDKKIECILLHN
jgi:hypothetical protein